VEARPVQLDELLASCHADTQQATGALAARGDPELEARAEALRRLAAAHGESLRVHAEDQAAVELRYLVVVPWRPDLPLPSVGTLRVPRRRKTGPVLRRPLAAHLRLARESLGHADALRAELEGLDLTARLLDGPEVADLLWRPFAPHAAQATPELGAARLTAPVLGALEAEHDPTGAARAADRLADSIAHAPLDFAADHRWAVIDGRGTLSIRVGPRVYWLATSEPHRDVPARQLTLEQADGDLWAALDLLADPSWHRAHGLS
jgi:hypothetical protein